MEDLSFFKRRRMIKSKLADYGFTEEDGVFALSENILDGQFLMSVLIEDGRTDTRVVDVASGEEYVLHRVPGAVGAFTGEVRAAYEALMLDIAEKCFEPDVFKSQQARELIAYIRKSYGDELEFLWPKLPDNAIWRRKDGGKWYAALLTVSRQKLGFPSGEMAEIIDLRVSPDKLPELLDGVKYLPGYHMNKKSWYTIVLDNSVPTGEICQRIDESYSLALK